LFAVLAGATVLTASALAGGGRAAAVSRNGVHRSPRAAALALVLHRGLGAVGLPGRGAGASSPPLPKGGRIVPEPGTSSMLHGIYCTSAANCWAVGGYDPGGGFDANEVLQWNGAVWTQVPAPSPAGSAAGDFSELLSVRCVGPRNCWAVGTYEPSGGAELDQALHWNGSQWSLVPTPTPGGTLSGDVNELFGVVCTSSASCWAAGEYGAQPGGTVLVNQMLHWNGHLWALATVPDPAGTATGDINILNSMRCTSAGNCLAVGMAGTLTSSSFDLLNQALQWNGSTWSVVTVPSPGGTTSQGAFSDLMGLACSSVTNCWATGAYGNFLSPETFINQALHWNGSSWTQVTTPDPNGTGGGAMQQLAFVDCQSATNCWAVGNYGNISGGSGVVFNQAVHWDGGAWAEVNTPEPGGAAPGDTNNLDAVRCTSTSDCWAVGMVQTPINGPQFAQALNWNGTAWFPG
jgi:hypothetical protein